METLSLSLIFVLALPRLLSFLMGITVQSTWSTFYDTTDCNNRVLLIAPTASTVTKPHLLFPPKVVIVSIGILRSSTIGILPYIVHHPWSNFLCDCPMMKNVCHFFSSFSLFPLGFRLSVAHLLKNNACARTDTRVRGRACVFFLFFLILYLSLCFSLHASNCVCTRFCVCLRVHAVLRVYECACCEWLRARVVIFHGWMTSARAWKWRDRWRWTDFFSFLVFLLFPLFLSMLLWIPSSFVAVGYVHQSPSMKKPLR